MKLSTIDTGFFKLDGGAMFGVVPKSIWKRLNPPDEKNLCTWAMRCLLVETDDRKILIDTGIGDKQDEKFFSYFEPSGPGSLIRSLEAIDLTPDDITDVFLTHLHFDHVGGAVKRNQDEYHELEPTFEYATYWTNEQHWKTATQPNAREKASFLKENILPLQERNRLKFVKKGEKFATGFEVIWVHGHTEAMMLPVLDYKGKKIIYMADLIPSSGHIKLPYIMAYDMQPLKTLSEKDRILNWACDNGHLLFFEHDPVHECASLVRTERGVKIDRLFKLWELK